MKKIFLLASLALGLMTSCQKEDFVAESVKNNPDFAVTATLDEALETRTQLSDKDNNGYKTLWTANDVISIFNAGSHYKYVINDGAGELVANFKYDPSFGNVTGGIEDEASSDVFVSVYPFAQETTVSKSGDDYVVNTVIPTAQKHVTGSFGQDAAPMVAVNKTTPSFSFKNVASVLIMPLKGEGTIVSATLESKAHKIAGKAVVTAAAANNFIPTVNVDNGESMVTLTCSDGVELDAENPTNFHFVLAPGTYEANDLVITFYDSYGNYFVTEISAANEFKRSKTLTFGTRTFKVDGTKEMDLWIEAHADAYMTADRIVPSIVRVKSGVSDVLNWAKNLKDKPNTKELIEEAIAYIGLKNFRAAYDILEGIPGFEKQAVRFEKTGEAMVKVDYSGVSYLKSFVDEIDKIHDPKSLIAFVEDFEKVYEASDIKNKLNEKVGNFSDKIDDYIDNYLDKVVNANPDEVDDAELFATYKSEIKKQLETYVDGGKSISAIIVAVQKYKSGALADEKKQIDNFVAAAEKLQGDLDSYTTKEDLEKAVNALPSVKVSVSVNSDIFPSYTILGQTINTAELVKKALEKLGKNPDKIEFTVTPDEIMGDALKEYEAKFAELLAANKSTITAGIRTTLEKLMGISVVELLEKAVADPSSTEGKFIYSLFADEEILGKVKSALKEVVEKIEQEAKDSIDTSNTDLKKAAIETARINAILNARVDADNKIQAEFNQKNADILASLNDGPWGKLKSLLNKEECVNIFTEYNMLNVYQALVKLTNKVEDILSYNKGATYYVIEDIDDYQENTDWWLRSFNE